MHLAIKGVGSERRPSLATEYKATRRVLLTPQLTQCAAPFLRLCPGQCGARHKSYPGLAWPQIYSAYNPIHGTDADRVQRFLAVAAIYPERNPLIAIMEL